MKGYLDLATALFALAAAVFWLRRPGSCLRWGVTSVLVPRPLTRICLPSRARCGSIRSPHS
jgi:hypothetical protein